MTHNEPHNFLNDQETLANEHEIRLAKVKKLEAEGLSAWPISQTPSATTQEALTGFAQHPSEDKIYSVAGRLIIVRDHGKTFFCKLQDRAGSLQIYLKKEIIGDSAFEHFKKYVDVGDIIWAEGPLFTTKTGEATLKAQKINLLSKCLHPLPEKYHGLVDVEQRYRQRHLDLISNPESREKFKKRSTIIQAIREFLQGRDFLEVETPMLHPIPGGAAARPFATHHNAYDMELYLRIAPELYLKRLVVGGFERVFEINRNFRNEGVSTKHNPEFTMLEFYQAYGDYHIGMETTEQLFQHAVLKNFDSLHVTFHDKVLDFTAPFKKLSIEESLCEIGGLSPDEILPSNIDKLIKQHAPNCSLKLSHGAKLFALFEACVESKIVQPTFITKYPIEVSPLAKRDEDHPQYASRFELFIAGMECANGFSELNDPLDQAERFKQQAHARHDGDQEAHHFDADYIKALEYGLAPTVGVGIGIDRLVMLLTNTTSIKDVILFPTLKLAHTSGIQKTHEKASHFSVDSAIFKKFPGTCLGTVVGYNLKNSAQESKQIRELLDAQEERIRELFATQAPETHPSINIWHKAYQDFGTDPKKYLPSIESLSTRILAGNKIKHVNTLVDLYNFVSLKYLLPAGGEDIDHLEGNIQLTFATEDDIPVVAFGEKSAHKPEVGEVIYKDQGGTLCRRWNWRGTERSKLTSNTTNAFFVFEALPPFGREYVEAAIKELSALLSHYCGGTIITTLVEEEHPKVLFDKSIHTK